MNIRQILMLGLFGIAMGIAAVFGLTKQIEPILWILIAFISAYLIIRSGESRLFITGFLAGLLMGILSGVIASIFFDTYSQNNPQVAEMFAGSNSPIPPRIFFLLTAPFIGAIYGCVVGLVTMLAKKVMK